MRAIAPMRFSRAVSSGTWIHSSTSLGEVLMKPTGISSMAACSTTSSVGEMVRDRTTVSCSFPFDGGAHQESSTGSIHGLRAAKCGCDSEICGHAWELNIDQGHHSGVQVGSHIEAVGDERSRSIPVPNPGLNQLIWCLGAAGSTNLAPSKRSCTRCSILATRL